jgi:predicted house-cleaning noncanonical NTP pyrophosphatase (MazG superfamily)
MKPKKLIRGNIIEKLRIGEYEIISDKKELNDLYALKVQEELQEVIASNHSDINEFADLASSVFQFARQNGFSEKDLSAAIASKDASSGVFSNIALNNLNPENPSNKIYFREYLSEVEIEAVENCFIEDKSYEEFADKMGSELEQNPKEPLVPITTGIIRQTEEHQEDVGKLVEPTKEKPKASIKHSKGNKK